ncbi:hypothetical protein D9M72_374650 [compost metagenome]
METSTPATMPPVSLAVPDTVTLLPWAMTDPSAGEEMEAVGAAASLLAVAAVSAGSRVPGWAPMSASRLIWACCIRGSAAAPFPSCSWSRPQVHWTVPAEKTSAPLAALYSVVLWVVVPGFTVLPKSWRYCSTAPVVVDSLMVPAGRKPLSRSSLDS